MGVLTGAKGPTGIAKWAVAKKELLLQGLDLPNGIPSRDVIRRVLSAVKVDAFQSCVATEEKSNEITAIPELMRLIDLKGAIGTSGRRDKEGTRTNGLTHVSAV